MFVCLFGFNVAFNIICHIKTVSGCDRKLNAHFYSAASLWYQITDSFTRYNPQSHYTDTGATSPSPSPKIRVSSGEQLVPLLTTLVCRGLGSNPVPPDLGADTLPTKLPRPVCKQCAFSVIRIILGSKLSKKYMFCLILHVFLYFIFTFEPRK